MPTNTSRHTLNNIQMLRAFDTGALCLVHAMLILESYGYYRAGKWLVSLGDASYTLYLSHLILLEIFYFVGLRNLFTDAHSTLLPLAGLLSILVLCITFSLLYYRYIEKPLYKKAISLGSAP